MPRADMDPFDGIEVVHGVLVSVANCGVLITGEAGTGKSECALELVTRSHKLVADDVVQIESVDGCLIGRPPGQFAGFLEIRGLGILDVRQMFGEEAFESQQRIELCIEFQLDDEPDRIGSVPTEINILGLKIPKVFIFVGRSRNTALLVETAVKISNSPKAVVDEEVIASHDASVAPHMLKVF